MSNRIVYVNVTNQREHDALVGYLTKLGKPHVSRSVPGFKNSIPYYRVNQNTWSCDSITGNAWKSKNAIVVPFEQYAAMNGIELAPESVIHTIRVGSYYAEVDITRQQVRINGQVIDFDKVRELHALTQKKVSVVLPNRVQITSLQQWDLLMNHYESRGWRWASGHRPATYNYFQPRRTSYVHLSDRFDHRLESDRYIPFEQYAAFFNLTVANVKPITVGDYSAVLDFDRQAFGIKSERFEIDFAKLWEIHQAIHKGD